LPKQSSGFPDIFGARVGPDSGQHPSTELVLSLSKGAGRNPPRPLIYRIIAQAEACDYSIEIILSNPLEIGSEVNTKKGLEEFPFL